MTDKPTFGPYLSERARGILEADLGRAQFGVCPECGGGDGYRNIYRLHFFYCDEHRLTWCPGSNLTSTWRDEKPKDWRAAWEHLKDYRTVDGYGEYEPGPPLGSKRLLGGYCPIGQAKIHQTIAPTFAG
jgi:hypothetical protein